MQRRFEPGDRIPTRNELTEHYGVSKVTVQRALQELTDQGFVEPRGTRGTFVAHTSPHLTRYYLLLPDAPATGPENQIWYALKREAKAMAEQGNADFICNQQRPGRGSRDAFDRMIEDVSSNRVAGLIFAQAPFIYAETALITQPDIPRVAIASRSAYGIPVIAHDYVSFLRLSLQSVRDAGRSRPAMLLVAGLPRLLGEARLQGLLEESGLSMPNRWMQAADATELEWIPNLIELLLDYPPEQRPDSLIITNDNFVEPATLAIQRLGLRVPEELHIVAQTNVPYPTPTHVPVTRIGFSIRECLRMCMRAIDAQRQGQSPPPEQPLPAFHAPANP